MSYALALFLAHRVYVDLQISDELSSVVVAQLLFLQSESNKKPIHMYINSPGIAAVPEYNSGMEMREREREKTRTCL